MFNFHGLGDEKFEEICCHLLYYNVGVENPDLNERPRKKQYGVDITADRTDGLGIDVASCKCYKSARKGQIEDWANEFLEHWESHWKTERVQRFILCVPFDLRSNERRRDIAAEKKRFGALGVKFEAWGLRQLSHQTHDHAAIKDIYFPSWRLHRDLGDSTRSAAQPSGPTLLSSVDVTQISLLQSALAQQIGAELDSAQLAMKRGEREAVGHTLEDVRSDPARWSALDPVARARILRMQALLALQRDDVARSGELLDQADAISPHDEPRARALWTLHRWGREEALAVIQLPNSADGALLRAGLLIEAGRFLEAKDVLQAWAGLKGVNAEWHRLAAYLACIDGDISKSLTEIEAAESLAPDWLAVIETGAIVRYAAALSPVAGFHSGGLPDPVPMEFVRQDDASRRYLAEAIDRFSRLAQGETQPPGRQRFELWRFAAIALLPERVLEAQSACLALLNQTPVPALAVFWAVARDYPVALKPILRVLEKQLKSAASTLDDLQAALICALANKDAKKAAAILARESHRFEGAQANKVIAHWRGRIALARRRLPPADSLTEPFEKAQALIQAASKAKNWAPVEALLQTDELRPEFKFLVCLQLAGHGQWQLVAAHIEDLLKTVHTAAAVRLAVYAWYNTGAFDRIAKALDEYLSCFPNSKIPAELTRLRAYAAVRGGELSTALPLATELAAGSGEATDQTFLIDLLINFGDVERAVPLVRQLLSQSDVKSQNLRGWVPAFATEAPDLARIMIQKVIAQGPDPAEAGFWVNWSYRLGLDSDAHRMLERFNQQVVGSPAPTVGTATMAEVIEHLKKHALRHEEMELAHLRGDAPIHAIVGLANFHLAQRWHVAFQSGRGNLFIRSGNRATDFFPSPVTGLKTLFIDTTALLSIEELSLFEVLDAAGVSLIFAHTVMTVLQHFAQEIRHPQPSRLATIELITQGVANQQIALWDYDSTITTSTAHVVYELGLDARDGSADSGSGAPARAEITLGALALELARRGGMSVERASEIRETLSGWQVIGHSVDAATVDTLIFDANTLDVAVGAGLLDSLRAHFALRVVRDHHVRCLEELNEHQERTRLENQLRALQRRIGDGVRNGRYRILPEPAIRPPDFDGKLPKSELLLDALFELLAQPNTPDSWVWIDDRACTAYTYSMGNPIVSTFEVIDYLKGNGALGEAQYYGLLDKLRHANVGILPVRPNEVEYRIKAAPLDEYQLTETAELRHIRRNLNRTLVLEPYLDIGDPPRHPQRLTEQACLLEALHVARRCLERIWTAEDFTDQHRLAASDWVWASLNVARLSRLPPNATTAANEKLWQARAAQLLLVALWLPSEKEASNQPSRREIYLRWLTHQIFELTEEADLPILDGLAESLGDYLVALLDLQPIEPTEERPVPRTFARGFIGRFVEHLPVSLQQCLHSRESFRSAFQPHIQTVVNLGEVSFVADSFWEALAHAQSGDSPSISSVSGESYHVKTKDATEFELLGPHRIHFKNADCALATSDLARREKFLAEECSLDVDLLPSTIGGMQGLARVEPPSERMRILQEQRERQPSARYSALRQLIDSGQDFAIDSLLPSKADLYVQYLGIRLSSDGAVDWDLSAVESLNRHGLEEVLRRWSGLPIALPEAIHTRVAARLPGEREALFSGLRSGGTLSPLLTVKLIELHHRARAHESSVSSGLVDHLSGLFSRWTTDTAALIAVLQWSDRVWHRDRSWRELPTALQLACVWAHAGRVLDLLMARDASAAVILEQFPKFHPSGLRTLLPFDRKYSCDIATPKRVSAPTLLVTALSTALGDDSAGVLSDRLGEALEHLCAPAERGVVPLPTLFADRRDGLNALGTWLARPASPPLAEKVELNGTRILSEEGKNQIREQTIAQLEENPASSELWSLIQLLGFEWLPNVEAARIEGIVRTLSPPDDSTDVAFGLIGHTVAAILPYSDADTHRAFETRLIETARRFASTFDVPVIDIRADTGAANAAGMIVEMAVFLSRRPALSDTATELGRICKQVVDAWPELAAPLRALLSRTLRELPTIDGAEVWNALVTLRAMT